jgi:hypothetical protein
MSGGGAYQFIAAFAAVIAWTALSSIIGSIVLIAVGKARGDEGEGIAARAQTRSMPCRTHDEGATIS